jgi:hypothetical protein
MGVPSFLTALTYWPCFGRAGFFLARKRDMNKPLSDEEKRLVKLAEDQGKVKKIKSQKAESSIPVVWPSSVVRGSDGTWYFKMENFL